MPWATGGDACCDNIRTVTIISIRVTECGDLFNVPVILSGHLSSFHISTMDYIYIYIMYLFVYLHQTLPNFTTTRFILVFRLVHQVKNVGK